MDFPEWDWRQGLCLGKTLMHVYAVTASGTHEMQVERFALPFTLPFRIVRRAASQLPCFSHGPSHASLMHVLHISRWHGPRPYLTLFLQFQAIPIHISLGLEMLWNGPLKSVWTVKLAPPTDPSRPQNATPCVFLIRHHLNSPDSWLQRCGICEKERIPSTVTAH